ncbi:hypothetical protein T552_00980 [Pneumocystis carinii B80]|uniref:Histone demethylase JARID1 n=1 Tax=Pneumocystis carinii (strain B80) TaxID=1408658 RepID=A0A0W4ZN22_PNEC8|nr:hypothetical protein T552_00980 [Pneumocystis carinii B80]KTW29773.1 hypothetical protein T552_00980 [Pneumocystis carinii B80]
MTYSPLKPDQNLPCLYRKVKMEPIDLSTVEMNYEGPEIPRYPRPMGLHVAPTFFPTEEEFKKPLKYIESISTEGKKYGIIKIIPPKTWKPTFSIDSETFLFRTRKQVLNSMEGGFRANVSYLDRLFKFHKQRGSPIKVLPTIDRQPIDLYRLKRAVESRGGYHKAYERRRWEEIGREFGYTNDGRHFSNAVASLRTIYQKYILPYDVYSEKIRNVSRGYRNQGKEQNEKTMSVLSNNFSLTKVYKNDLANNLNNKVKNAKETNMKEEGMHEDSNILSNNANKEKSESRSTRYLRKDVNGISKNNERLSSNGSMEAGISNKVEEVCEGCHKGLDHSSMLLCDGCGVRYHIQCLEYSLTQIPEREWYCDVCFLGTSDFGFEDGSTYSLKQFQEKANSFKKKYFSKKQFNKKQNCPTEADVEEEFWKLVGNVNVTTEVEYGADIHSTTHGSGFPTLEKNPLDSYSSDPWNLNILPLSPDSLLRHIKTNISGMTTPWLYVGMCFSAFCWHNEDHYTYSINYQHLGETKTWYGIPSSDADLFEQIMRNTIPELFEQQPDLLFQLVTMISPAKLVDEGVRVYAVDQHANQFVVTFPQAYHAGFNHGFNFNEAVNFAIPNWMNEGYSLESVKRYKEFRKIPVFSHDELLLTISFHENGIKTSMWLNDIINEMKDRELKSRKFLREEITDLTEELDETDIHEDQYQCKICKSYTYLSQIKCNCTPEIVCADHYLELCACEKNTRILRLRYSDEHLNEIAEKISERSNLPVMWTKKFYKAMSENERPSLKLMRSLLSEVEKIQYPIEEVSSLRSFVTRVNEWVENANNFITRKQQNRRKNEKVWRKGKIAELEERDKIFRNPKYLESLLKEAESLPFDTPEIQMLQEKADAIASFQNHARDVISQATVSSEQCLKIIELGKSFNVDIPEIEQFEQYYKQLLWIETVRDAENKYISLKEVNDLISEGREIKIPENNPYFLKLKIRKENGEAWEAHAISLMERETIPMDELIRLVDQASSLSISQGILAKVNSIINKIHEVHNSVQNIQQRILNPDFWQRPTATELKKIMDIVNTLPNPPEGVSFLQKEQQKLHEWIRRGKRLFGKANAPLETLGQHMEYVVKRNSLCLSLEDKPRALVVEPSSREQSPDPSTSLVINKADGYGISSNQIPHHDLFCLCRQPESGLMVECEICHEWYHGRCLKVSRKKLRDDDKWTCPICDYRVEIPRLSNRPKLEDMQQLLSDALFLPFIPSELDKLKEIVDTGVAFRNHIRPYIYSPLGLTSAEVPIMRFYLRKMEGSELLFAEETNFFKAKLHELVPIAPIPPQAIEISKSTRKPRPTKRQRELIALGLDPSSESSEKFTPVTSKKSKTLNVSQSSNTKKNVSPSPIPLICICRRPWIPNDSPKIYCFDCGNWFHHSCVGLNEAISQTLNQYLCPNCCKRRNQPYLFHINNYNNDNTLSSSLNEIHSSNTYHYHRSFYHQDIKVNHSIGDYTSQSISSTNNISNIFEAFANQGLSDKTFMGNIRNDSDIENSVQSSQTDRELLYALVDLAQGIQGHQATGHQEYSANLMDEDSNFADKYFNAS